MNKENATAAGKIEPTARITRARAQALGISGRILPNPAFKQDQKRPVRANTKRAASDEHKASVATIAGLQRKRRAVLKDVTNIFCENSKFRCTNATKVQTRKQARKCPSKKSVEASADVAMEVPRVEEDAKTKLAEELSKIRMVETKQDGSLPPKPLQKKKNVCHSTREDGLGDPMLLPIQASKQPAELQGPQMKGQSGICGKMCALDVVDIDSNLKDPQACSFYAPHIYNNKRVMELDQRPSTNYMERLQRDITPSMRGILIDWLVEVSEEYKLVPDALYITVDLIDRYLSQNYIEKQRLQLLGVTCMLIASKYEEICAPRVEEFCFITDNTYTKVEVLKMESQVLNFLHFQLSIPTTKTFLRRFIQAAQASYKVPSVELEYLANYLAELTLVEYNFLKFLPSLIAASAVFLARWTLNQSDHPWNPTLEHYTNYNALEMKSTVLALEDLQLNTNGCTLTAIRDKYKQQKFKCVANLTSSQRVLSLF